MLRKKYWNSIVKISLKMVIFNGRLVSEQEQIVIEHLEHFINKINFENLQRYKRD